MWEDVFSVWYWAGFDTLETAIKECPDDLWVESMWDVAKDPAKPQALGLDGRPHPLGNQALSAVWKVAWHALAACEVILNGRPKDFRTAFRPTDESWVAAEITGKAWPGKGEVLPLTPPSRDELLAYLEHNRITAYAYLAAARETGEGEAELGPWQGPTPTLLSMFHGNACHLVSHAAEVSMFVVQHR